MNCNWVKDNLCDILDGLLPSHLGEQYRAHLATCDNCRTLIDDLTLDKEALCSLPQVPPPAELMTGVLAVIKKPVKKQPWSFFARRLVPVAAAIVVTVTSINLWPIYFQPKEAPESARMETQMAPRVFTATSEDSSMTILEDKEKATETKPSLLVMSSMVGGTVFVAWGAVVFLWYKRR